MKCHLIDILMSQADNVQNFIQKSLFMTFSDTGMYWTRTDRQTSGTDTAIRTDISLRPDGRVIVKSEDGNWIVTTDSNVSLEAPVIVIVAGGGSFVPKKPPLKDIEEYEGNSVLFR